MTTKSYNTGYLQLGFSCSHYRVTYT